MKIKDNKIKELIKSRFRVTRQILGTSLSLKSLLTCVIWHLNVYVG
jgi:hypothetical protein